MDPNAALEQIRRLVRDQLTACDGDGYELAEAFDGLDGWLSKGGFPPDAWTRRS